MTRIRPTALLHPYFLGALALLAVNDHILKGLWPGFATGKLSDVAGPVVIAVVVAVLTGSRRVAVATTAVGFAALKLSPTVAVLAAPFLGGVTRTDPTDLVGLVALIPTYVWLGRQTTGDTDGERLPGASRPVTFDELRDRTRNAALVAVAILTTLSVTATSCEGDPIVVGLYVDPDDGVVAQVDFDSGYSNSPVDLYLSTDGGRSWEAVGPSTIGADLESQPPTAGAAPSASADVEGEADPDAQTDAEASFVDDTGAEATATVDADDADAGSGGLDPDAADNADEPIATPGTGPLYERVAETEGCLDDGRCFRAVQGEGVQEQVDGRWETVFRFSDDEIRRIELRGDSCSGSNRTANLFSSLAVVDGAGPGTGQSIVVSMGAQGVLVLDAASGEWERVAVGSLTPISLFGPSWLRFLVFTPVLALIASPFLYMVNRNHNGVSRGRRVTAAVVGTVLSLSLALIVFFLFAISLGSFDYAVGGIGTAIATVAVLLVSLAFLIPTGSRNPPPPIGSGRQ